MQNQRITVENESGERRINEHAQKAAARFDGWAATYGEDRLAPWFRFYQAFAISRLNLTEAGSFLDVGCGPGWAVREASKHIHSGKACGIDISPKMINKAIAQSEEIKNIEFRVASVDTIPYPEESFRSVLCTSSFHHYQNPLGALSEIRRVMKKEGKLVILDAARNVSLPIWLQDRWRRYFERSHVKYYTTNEMKALVERAQLHLVGDIVTSKRFMFRGKMFTGLMLLECAK